MVYKLKFHDEDTEMVEATTTAGNGIYLAFVIHVDMLPPHIVERLAGNDEAEVSIDLVGK